MQNDLVLIIDEDGTARDLYAHWFMDRGFDVMHAIGITEANGLD